MKSALVLSILLFASLANADCGNPEIKIEGATPSEFKISCDGFEKLSNYFRSMGFNKQPAIKLIFKDEVFLPNSDRVRVHGYFDTDTNEIHMTHFEGKSQKTREPWGLPWSEPMASSLLWHEMAHLFAVSAMGQDFKRLGHAWHEFIAYSIQLEMMDEALRAKLLSGFDTKAFENVSEVSEDLYALAPEFFAVKCYLSFKSWGGSEFVRKLLSGELKP